MKFRKAGDVILPPPRLLCTYFYVFVLWLPLRRGMLARLATKKFPLDETLVLPASAALNTLTGQSNSSVVLFFKQLRTLIYSVCHTNLHKLLVGIFIGVQHFCFMFKMLWIMAWNEEAVDSVNAWAPAPRCCGVSLAQKSVYVKKVCTVAVETVARSVVCT